MGYGVPNHLQCIKHPEIAAWCAFPWPILCFLFSFVFWPSSDALLRPPRRYGACRPSASDRRRPCAASAVETAAAAITNNTVGLNHTFNVAPLALGKSVALLNQQVSYGPASASLQADMDPNANAQVAISRLLRRGRLRRRSAEIIGEEGDISYSSPRSGSWRA
ncbi:hypothetical protein K438DRAFT_454706 [Mycena galopus ATCC 62051]|nr:hypothetical protein K438DRAFT_454706 [Mycena galopus ATCC 62051]